MIRDFVQLVSFAFQEFELLFADFG